MTQAATEQSQQQPDGTDDQSGEQQGQGTDAQGGAGTDGQAKDWEAEFKAQQKINRDLERRNGVKLKELEQQLAAATAKPAEDGDAKPDLDKLRQEVRAEVATESLRERALDKIEAKAARKFANPEDARTFLASRVDEFVSDGKVDLEAINDSLDDLLKDRPYLAAAQGDGNPFNGTADGGPRGTAGKPQLTEADVKRLSKEGKHEEIEQARKDGRLDQLLHITPSP